MISHILQVNLINYAYLFHDVAILNPIMYSYRIPTPHRYQAMIGNNQHMDRRYLDNTSTMINSINSVVVLVQNSCPSSNVDPIDIDLNIHRSYHAWLSHMLIMNTFNDQSGHDPNFKRQVGWVPDGSGKGNLPQSKVV